jgi:Fic family protein
MRHGDRERDWKKEKKYSVAQGEEDTRPWTRSQARDNFAASRDHVTNICEANSKFEASTVSDFRQIHEISWSSERGFRAEETSLRVKLR